MYLPFRQELGEGRDTKKMNLGIIKFSDKIVPSSNFVMQGT